MARWPQAKPTPAIRPAVPTLQANQQRMKGITMTARTQEQILADLFANTGRAANLRRELAANQSHNWLLASPSNSELDLHT